MSVADQFLFGYDDGHRLLTGSRELDPRPLVTLLGATDAQMPTAEAPLLTGLALAGAQEYAFCVTWSAAEAPRPGPCGPTRSWSSAADLADERASAALLGLPRRPAAGASYFGSYRAAVELDVRGSRMAPAEARARAGPARAWPLERPTRSCSRGSRAPPTTATSGSSRTTSTAARRGRSSLCGAPNGRRCAPPSRSARARWRARAPRPSI